MKIVSTDIGEGSVELTYADSAQLDDASKLLIVRMPIEAQEVDSVAFHQIEALQQTFDFLRAEIQRLHNAIRR